MKKIPVRLLAGAQNPYVRLHDLIKEKENPEFPFFTVTSLSHFNHPSVKQLFSLVWRWKTERQVETVIKRSLLRSLTK